MRKQTAVYDTGLPFSQSLAVDVIDESIKNLKRVPSILAIDGTAGTGKTTLAVHIAEYINKGRIRPEQLAFGGKDLIHKAEEVSKNKLKVIIFDEADIDKRGSLTKFNLNLMGFFREYRSLSILIILIIQNVSWLDNRLWEMGVVDGLIHLHTPTKNDTSYSVYDLENLSYLLYKMSKMGMQKRKAYSFCKGYMRGKFIDLPEERRIALEVMSNEQKAQSRKRRKKVS